jgi:hypothetical protein
MDEKVTFASSDKWILSFPFAGMTIAPRILAEIFVRCKLALAPAMKRPEITPHISVNSQGDGRHDHLGDQVAPPPAIHRRVPHRKRQ